MKFQTPQEMKMTCSLQHKRCQCLTAWMKHWNKRKQKQKQRRPPLMRQAKKLMEELEHSWSRKLAQRKPVTVSIIHSFWPILQICWQQIQATTPIGQCTFLTFWLNPCHWWRWRNANNDSWLLSASAKVCSNDGSILQRKIVMAKEAAPKKVMVSLSEMIWWLCLLQMEHQQTMLSWEFTTNTATNGS